MRRTGLLLISAFLLAFTGGASAKEVVIVTSFPKELFETYKKAFELKNPGITLPNTRQFKDPRPSRISCRGKRWRSCGWRSPSSSA
jgi:hypothetical protein